ncbi:DUF3368 domain-containing protein [Crocosphaera sp. Alani8]|uniref:DUF3368 domain-containing protein n=1 Tax=Crocosphaera sp. Alani8 TaxID=3038952 RepID=UPI00313A8A4E
MIIVSNTSPLSSLAKIDRLNLLEEIYHNIIIPQAVYDELIDIKAGKKINNTIKNANWIQIRAITNKQLVSKLEHNLDRGEAEAITLSVELKANLLLIDERLGRREANQLGLTVTGVLGVLLIAKKRGLINQVKVVMDELILQTTFRVSSKLYDHILKEVNE